MGERFRFEITELGRPRMTALDPAAGLLPDFLHDGGPAVLEVEQALQAVVDGRAPEAHYAHEVWELEAIAEGAQIHFEYTDEPLALPTRELLDLLRAWCAHIHATGNPDGLRFG